MPCQDVNLTHGMCDALHGSFSHAADLTATDLD
jgi:hypothetical protein